MFKYLLFILLTIFFLACSDDPKPTTCDPVCDDSFQECVEDQCKTKAGFCFNDTECNGDSCNIVTHKCEVSLCDPKCGYWQECNESDKTCRTKESYCDDDKPCLSALKPVCDPTSHVCKAESTNCDPSCDASWQYCLNGECLTRLGRCGEDRLCTDEDLPLCDEVSHVCIEASQGCDPRCKEWQVCNTEQVCITKAGFCNKHEECYDLNYPLCDLTTHTCQAEVINYVDPTVYTPKALIITKVFLKEKFEELALMHTLTGVPTEVVTIADICANTTCNDSDKRSDTTKAIKDYIISKSGTIDYVLLGGDIEVVPSRYVHDTFDRDFQAAGQTAYSAHYQDSFYTDYYYADLSEWDGNHDGLYAKDGVDTPDYTPEVAVSRLSVSTVAELEGYIAKAKSYLTDYFDTDKIEHVLILTNVATNIDVPGQDRPVPLDAANYIELEGDNPKTRYIIEHNTVGANIDFTKLYNSTSSDWGSKKLSCDTPSSCNIIWSIEEDGPADFNGNPNLIVHMGHGSENLLMTEFDGENAFSGDMAMALRNDNYPIMLSCACQAGTFSVDDSAGEKFVNNPNGGGIAYLGDASYGLGIAGGSQLMDEFLRYMYNTANLLIGDAVFNAHKNLPHSDIVGYTVMGIPLSIDAIDPQAYEWTQKVATFLGDIMLPIWNSPKDFPKDIGITKSVIQGTETSEIHIQFTGSLPDGSIVIIKTNNGNFYEANLSFTDEILLPINENPSSLEYGYRSNKTLYMLGKVTF